MAVTVQRSLTSLASRRHRANLFAPIVEVVLWLAPGKQGGGVRRNARSRVRCVHPSHYDQTPSATIFVADNRFYCWAGRRGGRPVALTEWVRGCDQAEAVSLLEEQFHLSAFPLDKRPGASFQVSPWDDVTAGVEAAILRRFGEARKTSSRFCWSVWSSWFWDVWDLRADFGLTLMACRRLAKSVILRYLS